MFDGTKLLVVDDESLICQACERILTPYGFDVDTNTDATKGLKRAVQNDYSAILLDVKMPTLDGIGFLEQLRKIKADVPVILITGHANMKDAAAAVRLDATDYLTKPFAPEDVLRAVHRAVKLHDTQDASRFSYATRLCHPWIPSSRELRFWGSSWMQPGSDGTIRVGAVLTREQAENLAGVRFPRIGETVYQGLPLAGLTQPDGRGSTLAAPLSGVVIDINDGLARDPTALERAPFESGWIGRICPTRLEEEEPRCLPRRLGLVNSDPASAQEQKDKLTALGCQVTVLRHWREIAQVLAELADAVLFVDAASLGAAGPDLVERINAVAPAVRIVVLATSDARNEPAYRRQRILYYALNPFVDREIVDVLDVAFKPRVLPRVAVGHKQPTTEALTTLAIKNGTGDKVRLLGTGSLLLPESRLGGEILRKLEDRLYTVEVRSGEDEKLTPLVLLNAAHRCRHLLVLQAKDRGRLPGSLLRDTVGEFPSTLCEDKGNVTPLVVQPAADGQHPLDFNQATTTALAEHIAYEVALCCEAADAPCASTENIAGRILPDGDERREICA